MTWADRILTFNQSLAISHKLPKGVDVLNPFLNAETRKLCTKFYRKYYGDNLPRKMILGINPGRFGAGLTGIPFTDPVKLEVNCGIQNELPKKAELSADFIYQLIDAYGGPEKFYKRYYFSSVSPLGFTKDNKNLNYYDLRPLQESVTPFIINSIKTQLDFGFTRDVCYCLGEGKNFVFLSRLNLEWHFFKKIVPLPHPRFVMQYKRKSVRQYLQRYQALMGLKFIVL